MINPLYQSTAKLAIELTTNVETLKGSSKQLAITIEAVATHISDLESEIDIILAKVGRLGNELSAEEGVVSSLRDDYTNEMKAIEMLKMENFRRQDELDIKRESRDETRKELNKMKKNTTNHELEIDALTRKVQKTEGVRTVLAAEAEEVALLQVSAKNASGTGTTIFFMGQANPQKVAPGRAKIVVASLLASLFVCLLLVWAARIVRTAS
jgi:chromosome segregation ATPase